MNEYVLQIMIDVTNKQNDYVPIEVHCIDAL